MNMRITDLQVDDAKIPVERIIALIRERKIVEGATIAFVLPHMGERRSTLHWVLNGEVSVEVGIKGLGLDKPEEK